MAGGGDAQREQSDPSSMDRPMGEVQEEASLTGEGDVEQEQSDASSGDPSISEDDMEVPLTMDGATVNGWCLTGGVV